MDSSSEGFDGEAQTVQSVAITSTTRISFLSLPFELRDRIYQFMAVSCIDMPPLAARSFRARWPSWGLAQPEIIAYRLEHSIHAHTFHNLLRVSSAMYAEVLPYLYRYVSFQVTLETQPLRHALGITRPEDYSGPKYILDQLANCHVLVVVRDPSKQSLVMTKPSEKSNYDSTESIEIRGLLDWWLGSIQDRPPSAQMHIRLNEFAGPDRYDYHSLIPLEQWLSDHDEDHELLQHCLRFTLTNIDRVFEEDLRTCTMTTQSGLVAQRQRRYCVAALRRFCRINHTLMISDIDWTTIEVKTGNKYDLEGVPLRAGHPGAYIYSGRVRPRVPFHDRSGILP